MAGRRGGEKDERFLWPEVARIIREIRPEWILLENVPGILSVNRGRVFGRILADLSASGYDAEWTTLSAAQFGAPHLRFRVFIVAHAQHDAGAPERGQCADASGKGSGRRDDRGGGRLDAQRQEPDGGAGEDTDVPHANGQQQGWGQQSEREQDRRDADIAGHGPEGELADATSGGWGTWRPQFTGQQREASSVSPGTLANADEQGLEIGSCITDNDGEEQSAIVGGRGEWGHVSDADGGRRPQCDADERTIPEPDTDSWQVEPDVGCRPHGFSAGLGGPWGPGWEDGIPRVANGVKDRVNKLRCLGNAVVPQVAQFVGEMILSYAENT